MSTAAFDPIQIDIPTAEPVWARWIRLVALRRCLWMQHWWSLNEALGASPHGEAVVLLRDPDLMRQQEAAFLESDSEVALLNAAIQETEEALEQDAAWMSLAQSFRLGRAELELLAVCAAAEANPDIERVYGYLLDQSHAAPPSPWLASKLFGWAPSVRPHPESPLYRWRLAYPRKDQAEPWSASSAWMVDPAVMHYLNGALSVDPEIAEAVHALDTAAVAGLPCLYEEVRDEIGEFVTSIQHQPATRYEIEFAGSHGSGRKTFAAQIARLMERELMVIDSQLLTSGEPTPAQFQDRVARALRTAALFQAIPYWRNASAMTTQAWDSLRAFGGIHFLGVDETASIPTPAGVIRRRFKLPMLTFTQRVDLWQRLTGQEPPTPIQEWALKPSEVVAAAQVASAGVEAVHDVCRQRLQQEPGELFTVLPCPYGWDDFVLAPGIEAHLREFESQARMRRSVYEDWGYEKHCPLGVGIAALFAGPSGTGKTMAAQVLARSLDLQLFKVDLANVLNKYVGETEKRLRSVFERCQRSNVMLFFDEADALFGHRVQTKDAQDRFANIEIDYLLQQMESYSGIAVLATNRKGELDQGFLRRLRFVVDFMPPSPAERARLWKLALLQTSPSGEELLDKIDWDYLATKLNLTGADIKNSAISAAFLARAEGTRIGMRHLIAAVRRELTKQGVVLRPGDWENHEWQS